MSRYMVTLGFQGKLELPVQAGSWKEAVEVAQGIGEYQLLAPGPATGETYFKEAQITVELEGINKHGT